MPTLIRQRDLALQLGLTQSTVSKALRGHPGVCPEVRKKILEGALQAGYALPSGAIVEDPEQRKTKVLCVDIPHANEWQGRLLEGVVTAARELACEIVVSLHSKNSLPQVVARRQVDGLVRLMNQSDYQAGGQPSAAPVPTVSVLYPVPGADVVSVDHFGSARALGLYLGALRPGLAAYVGLDEPVIGHARYAGLRAGLEAGGSKLPPELARFSPTLQADWVMPRVEELLDLRAGGRPEHQFTLMGFYNDFLARHAVPIIRRRGLRVPEDIGVAGYDDVETAVDAELSLVTVHLPLEELGAAAIRRLHWRLDHPDEPPLHWLLDTQVVEGNSVAGRD